MKSLPLPLLLLLLSSCFQPSQKGPLLLPYEAFGPQSSSYGIIGYRWFQWNSQGPESPTEFDSINIVVYKNTPLEEIKNKFPISQPNKKDFRYLKYETAVSHLKKLILEFKSINVPTEQLTESLSEIQGHFK